MPERENVWERSKESFPLMMLLRGRVMRGRRWHDNAHSVACWVYSVLIPPFYFRAENWAGGKSQTTMDDHLLKLGITVWTNGHATNWTIDINFMARRKIFQLARCALASLTLRAAILTVKCSVRSEIHTSTLSWLTRHPVFFVFSLDLPFQVQCSQGKSVYLHFFTQDNLCDERKDQQTKSQKNWEGYHAGKKRISGRFRAKRIKSQSAYFSSLFVCVHKWRFFCASGFISVPYKKWVFGQAS